MVRVEAKDRNENQGYHDEKILKHLLKIRELKTGFTTEKGIVPAVDGVSMAFYKGKTTGVVGESGCGKSMTALSILQLVPSPPGKIIGGSILLEDRELLQLSKKEMLSIRGREISMIFQEPMTSLNPVYTVGRQVMEVFQIHQKLNKKEAREKTLEMFERVGIPEASKRLEVYPHQLSGGLRQRVMIAMALSCKPKLLIADEPTTALDVTIQAQILSLMKNLQKEINAAIMMITHDLGIVAETCDDVYVMYAGKIMEYADIYEIFEAPLHPYTLGLLKSVPKLLGETERLYSIQGIVPNLLNLPRGCRFHPRCEHAKGICKEKEPEYFQAKKNHFVRCWLYGDKE